MGYRYRKKKVIIRDHKTGTVLKTKNIDGGDQLVGKKLTTEQSKAITRGDSRRSRGGTVIKNKDGSVTKIYDTPLSVDPNTQTAIQKQDAENKRIAAVRAEQERDVTPTGVYDNVGQQSRALTPFEQIAIGNRIRDQRQSFDTRGQTPDNRTFTQVRDDLLKDPDTQRVYVRSESQGPRIVGVERRPQEIPQEKPPTPLKDYNTISASPKSSKFWMSPVGEFVSGVKRGFGMQPVEYGRDLETMSYPYQYGYVGGVVGSIASWSVIGWEYVGSKAANVAYQYPKVYQGVQYVGSLSRTKQGTKLVRAGWTAYGASAVGGAVQGYREDGSVGLARSGFKSLRVPASIGGLTTGFKDQMIKNFDRNVYVVKGKSTATTKTRGDRFATVIKSRGTVDTFNPYGRQLQGTQRFYDKTIFQGSTQNIAKGTSKSGVNARVDVVRGSTRSQTSYYKPNSQGMTKIGSKSATDKIDAIIGTRSKEMFSISTPRGQISAGVGGSKFKFYTFTGRGAGRVSRFDYVRIGDVTRVRGRTGSVTDKVTTQLKFKEGIYNIGKKSSSSTGAGTSKTKLVEKRIGQNVGNTAKQSLKQNAKPPKIAMSGPVKQTTSPVLETPKPPKLETPKGEISAVSTPQKPKAKPKAQTKSMIAIDYDYKPPKEKTESKVDQRLYIEGKTKSRSKSRSRSRSELRGEQALNPPKIDQVPKIGLGLVQGQTQGQRQGQRQRSQLTQISQGVDPVPRPRPFTGGGVTSPLIKPPPPPSLFIPSYKPNKRKRKRRKAGSSKRQSEYSPSIEANLFGVTSRKKPSKELIESGLFTRPILRRS